MRKWLICQCLKLTNEILLSVSIFFTNADRERKIKLINPVHECVMDIMRIMNRIFMSSFIVFGVLAMPVWASEGGAAATASFPAVESFEAGVPSYVSVKKGKLSIDHDHVQDGKSSLRWGFQDGSELVFHTGLLGNTNVYTGYGGYSRSSFTLHVYLTEKSSGKLKVNFFSDEVLVGYYEIPMQHVGWQQIVYHYSWHTKIHWLKPALKNKINSIRIKAMTPKASVAYLDKIYYNKPRDFRDARLPVAKGWEPIKLNLSGMKKPSSSELEHLRKLEDVYAIHENPKISAASWEKRIAANQRRIESEGMVKGKGIHKNLGHYFGILGGIGSDYNHCAYPKQKQQLAAQFFHINDWLQENGLVVNGSLGKANNYIGRTYVDAIFKMRHPLAQHGSLEKSLAYIKWSYNYDERFFGGKPGQKKVRSMDYFHNEATRLLKVALMHAKPIERWHHVQIFRKNLSQELVDSIKPDGSLFHHGMHYFAYGSMGMSSISDTLRNMSSVGLEVSEPALDAVKRALMQMRWYAGGRTILLSLCGRHPSGKQSVPAQALLRVAQAYAPYRGGKWDRELTEAYLRFEPKKAKGEAFKEYRIEQAPHGHRTMPYAGLGLHRQANWLAGVKGFSNYVASGESYANANRFMLYLSNGSLELQTHPLAMPSVRGSGVEPDKGWDWLAIPGTTSIYSSLQMIANGNGSFHERGGGGFNGGLSHDHRYGVFVHHISSKTQAAKARKNAKNGGPFNATKTYFFFANRIVCLGSNISVDGVDYPVRTTLFQKFLTPEHGEVLAGDEHLKLTTEGKMYPVVRDYKPGRVCLRDPYGNYYFVSSDDRVHLRMGEQVSRDGYDRNDTNGNYATAWIEHGKNPKSAGYEYMVLVQPNEAQAKACSRQFKLAQGAGKPYSVIQRNAVAHVVYDKASKTTGYAIFSEKAGLGSSPHGVLVGVDRPCLVMVEDKGDHYMVSVTVPDVREKETKPIVVSLALKGDLKFHGQLPKGHKFAAVTSAQDGEKKVMLSVPVMHGESHSVRLDK